jgi:hypothetical protein
VLSGCVVGSRIKVADASGVGLDGSVVGSLSFGVTGVRSGVGVSVGVGVTVGGCGSGKTASGSDSKSPFKRTYALLTQP